MYFKIILQYFMLNIKLITVQVNLCSASFGIQCIYLVAAVLVMKSAALIKMTKCSEERLTFSLLAHTTLKTQGRHQRGFTVPACCKTDTKRLNYQGGDYTLLVPRQPTGVNLHMEHALSFFGA
jgi:hypothetical protein